MSSLFTSLIFKAISYDNLDTPIIFKLRFPNGTEIQNRPGEVDLTIAVKHWTSFLRIALFGPYGFATDYVKQRIDIDGDLRYMGNLAHHPYRESQLVREIKKNVRPDPVLIYLMNRWHMLMRLA